MTPIYSFLKRLLPTIESQQERDEAYLAEAVDLHDLERRMRAIDERGRRGPAATALALFSR